MTLVEQDGRRRSNYSDLPGIHILLSNDFDGWSEFQECADKRRLCQDLRSCLVIGRYKLSTTFSSLSSSSALLSR